MAAKIGLQKQLQISYPYRKYFTSLDKGLLTHLRVSVRGYEWGCDTGSAHVLCTLSDALWLGRGAVYAPEISLQLCQRTRVGWRLDSAELMD